jgi:deoxyadenosine/deoxycytidine kinase
MGARSSSHCKSSPEAIARGLVGPYEPPVNQEPRIFSLDGNIGVGKTTLLKQIAERFPNIVIVREPVDIWTDLKNPDGSNLLELFYSDKERWAYTFQTAAFLSRLKLVKDALLNAKPGQIILTERSVLTDRYVFAEMLRAQGILTDIEWTLYTSWFDTFATGLPIKGIIHINTSVETALSRIKGRGRDGESGIESVYLTDLAGQHKKWLDQTDLPVLNISTEVGVDVNKTLNQLGEFLQKSL